MNDGFLRRLEREAGIDGLLDILTDKLSPHDLQSLLLMAFERRATTQTPTELLRRFQENRFVKPSPLSPQRSAQLMVKAWALLPEGFEAIELSPLAPLGTCSGLAPVGQNKVLSSLRGCEVSADPAPILALNCALRRRSCDQVDLATWQRVVRAQALQDGPGYYAHFGILALASAARYCPTWEAEALRAHLSYFASFLADCAPDCKLVLKFTDWSGGKLSPMLEREVFPALEGVDCRFDPDRLSGRGYYEKGCFKLFLDEVEIGDGGFTDWTRKLMSDGREGFLSSGIGWERLVEKAGSLETHRPEFLSETRRAT